MPYKIKRSEEGYWVVRKDSGRKMHKKPYQTYKQASKYLLKLKLVELRAEGK